MYSRLVRNTIARFRSRAFEAVREVNMSLVADPIVQMCGTSTTLHDASFVSHIGSVDAFATLRAAAPTDLELRLCPDCFDATINTNPDYPVLSVFSASMFGIVESIPDVFMLDGYAADVGGAAVNTFDQHVLARALSLVLYKTESLLRVHHVAFAAPYDDIVLRWVELAKTVRRLAAEALYGAGLLLPAPAVGEEVYCMFSSEYAYHRLAEAYIAGGVFFSSPLGVLSRLPAKENADSLPTFKLLDASPAVLEATLSLCVSGLSLDEAHQVAVALENPLRPTHLISRA